MNVSLHIHGAAGTVTGACYRLAMPHGQILIDCGMFQGPKSLRTLNYRNFPFEPTAIESVVLSHAHIDHTGLFPKLALGGFRGKAWATHATKDLLRWLLPDAGAIQEADVERLNRRNSRRAEGQVIPIYTRADAEAALGLLAPQPYDSWFEPLHGVRARMRNAGHILGSAFIEVEIPAKPRPMRLTFSGDIGPQDKALQPDPTLPEPCDVLLLESTYGDRTRDHLDDRARRAALAQELNDALRAGGNIIVPVFAVERTQEILHDIGRLKREGILPPAPVFVDSPLAGRATEVFFRHRRHLEPGSDGQVFANPEYRLTETVEQSKAIGRITAGAIILAGSGMCEAGRVKHHLKDHLWRRDSTVLFVGYQAPGTLGGLIRNGTSKVRIHGEEIDVRARIRSLDGYSGHADRQELVQWARPTLPVLGSILLVHGEPEARNALAESLTESGLDRRRIHLPDLDQEFEFAFHEGRWQALSQKGAAAPRLDAAQVSARRDWHNDYAALLLDLRNALRQETDDRRRRSLLSEMRRLIDMHRARGG